MPTIEDAIALALQAHYGQVDKYGQPYIYHPLRVMLNVTGDDARMVAILHDVVEDSLTTLDDLRRMGYSEAIVAAVDCLTHRPDETYEQSIQRIKPNPLAVCVKLADLQDNMDIRRMDAVREKDTERLQRYLAAWRELNDVK